MSYKCGGWDWGVGGTGTQRLMTNWEKGGVMERNVGDREGQAQSQPLFRITDCNHRKYFQAKTNKQKTKPLPESLQVKYPTLIFLPNTRLHILLIFLLPAIETHVFMAGKNEMKMKTVWCPAQGWAWRRAPELPGHYPHKRPAPVLLTQGAPVL